MVAGEQQVLEQEAEVVRCVPGRVDGGDGPGTEGDLLAVLHSGEIAAAKAAWLEAATEEPEVKEQ